jgi:hypothetical protein
METAHGKCGFLNTVITADELIWRSTDIQMYVTKEPNIITENESSQCFQSLCEQYNKYITFLMELWEEYD